MNNEGMKTILNSIAPWHPPTDAQRVRGYDQFPGWGNALQPLMSCSGDMHVFGCQHAEACRCGKATRTVEPRVCPHCKKAHD